MLVVTGQQVTHQIFHVLRESAGAGAELVPECLQATFFSIHLDGSIHLALITTKAQVRARHLGRQAPRHPDEVRAAGYL